MRSAGVPVRGRIIGVGSWVVITGCTCGARQDPELTYGVVAAVHPKYFPGEPRVEIPDREQWDLDVRVIVEQDDPQRHYGELYPPAPRLGQTVRFAQIQCQVIPYDALRAGSAELLAGARAGEGASPTGARAPGVLPG